jgi:hypothetical protein
VSDEPEPVVYTATLACLGCDALLATQSVAPDHGLACCPICGGSLMELADSWGGGEASAETGRGTRIVVISPPAGPEGRLWRPAPAPSLVVRATRHRRPDTWTYSLDALAVTEHGFSDAEAMTKLVEAVRASVRDVLTPAGGPDPRRDLALRLSLADTQGRLEEVLTDALVLDDEHAERLLRERGE